MRAHLRASLWLLLFTVLLCSVLYPLALYGIGQAAFRDKAEGSLIDARGEPTTDPAKAVGSRLIAQQFTGPQYFQPRPSATTPSYNAAASGASNYGASNYLLRERVAQALGPIVKYGSKHPRAGELIGPYLEEWLHDHPRAVTAWTKAHPEAPRRWLSADKANAALVAGWKKETGKEGDPEADDVVPYFESLVANSAEERKNWKDPVHAAVQAVFFESWRDAHAADDLKPVPADMVMTSGSGLDPHITLDNALYQLDGVVDGWAEPGDDKARIKADIEAMLNDTAEAPFGGLAGVKLVNVLEINVALRERYKGKKAAR